jgi:hypothetical protein
MTALHVLLLLAPSLAAPGLTFAQVAATTPPLTREEVSDACDSARSAPGDDRFAAVRDACDAVSRRWPGKSDWSKVVLPSARALRDAAAAKPKMKLGPRAEPTAKSIAPAGISPEAILWGSTQFLMNRAEAELRLWLVDRLFDWVCDGVKLRNGEKLQLLPETCKLEGQIHFAGLASSPPLIRAAVQRDLVGLPAAVLHVAVDDLSDKEAAASLDPTLVAFEGAVAIESWVTLGNARSGFEQVAPRIPTAYLDCAAAPVACAAYDASLVLASFHGIKDLKTLGDDQWGLALLTASVNAADPSTASAEGPAWSYTVRMGNRDGIAVRLYVAYDAARRIASRLDVISGELARLRSADDAEKSPEERTRVRATATAALAAEATAFVRNSARVLRDPDPPGRVDGILSELESAWRAMGQENYVVASAHLLGAVGLGMKDGSSREKALRAAGLALEIAQAQDPGSVEAVLERYAAPAGSYVGKHRGAHFYAGVNAYFGGAFAMERAQEEARSWRGAAWNPAAAVWAPVGIEVGRSTPCGSFGLFAQVVDLGALASWRMRWVSDDKVATQPVVGFKQVLSPGGYLVWGVPDMPVSVAAGVALSPSLRTVGDTSSDERSAWRIGVAVGIDIPVFP